MHACVCVFHNCVCVCVFHSVCVCFIMLVCQRYTGGYTDTVSHTFLSLYAPLSARHASLTGQFEHEHTADRLSSPDVHTWQGLDQKQPKHTGCQAIIERRKRQTCKQRPPPRCSSFPERVSLYSRWRVWQMTLRNVNGTRALLQTPFSPQTTTQRCSRLKQRERRKPILLS